MPRRNARRPMPSRVPTWGVKAQLVGAPEGNLWSGKFSRSKGDLVIGTLNDLNGWVVSILGSISEGKIDISGTVLTRGAQPQRQDFGLREVMSSAVADVRFRGMVRLEGNQWVGRMSCGVHSIRLTGEVTAPGIMLLTGEG